MDNVIGNDFKGHICLSLNGGQCCRAGNGSSGGGTGGGTDNGSGGGVVQIDKALNFALLVPENTTWDNFDQNLVVVDSLPKSVAVNKAYTLPSPFGKNPCIAVPYVKNPHTGQWQEVSSYIYPSGSGYNKVGVKASCPGDGNVYLATATLYLAVAAANSQGTLAPAATAGSGNFTSAEIVIGLWCATGDALADSAAFQALEARVTALEAARA